MCPRRRKRRLNDGIRMLHGEKEIHMSGSSTIRHLSFVIYAVATASALAIGGTDSPPAPAAPSEPHFAQAQETKLDNGLRVIVAERRGLPLVAAQVVVATGSEADAAGLAGTASMTGSL